MTFAVRRLVEGDVVAFRDIRLEGLTAEPTSFGATLEEDAGRTVDQWTSWLRTTYVFGVLDGDAIAGIAAYYVEQGAKTKHRGHVVSVYVRPAYRGTGAAALLFEALLASARQNVRFLYLQVTQHNPRAVRFYQRSGFTIYADDPGGLMVDGTLYDDYLMMLRLDEGSAESDK